MTIKSSMLLKPLLSALLVCYLHSPMATAAEISLPAISNGKPRLDTDGMIVDLLERE